MMNSTMQSSGVGTNNPNHSIDIGQLPMRLVNQKNGNKRNANGNGTNRNQFGPGNNAKNAWQSIDAS
jgi:hypothetical protein